MIRIAPSLLSCDFGNLASEVRRTAQTSAELLHLDVMDGRFVPNLTFGPPVISAVRGQTEKTFDVHLMIEEPIRYAERFARAGADILTVHLEACSDPASTLRKIRALGKKAGLSLKPKTDPRLLVPYLADCDLILVMSVEPGFGGQSFLPETMKHVVFLKKAVQDAGLSIPIEVDGGITEETVGIAAKAGAEIFVAGSAVYGRADISAAVDALRRAALAALAENE